MMTPSPKKWSCPPKIFSLLSLKILFFLKQLLNDKIFEIFFPIKKVIFIIVARRLVVPLLHKRLGPQKRFSDVFSENYPFFEKIGK